MNTDTINTRKTADTEATWPTVRIQLSRQEEPEDSIFVQIERHCPMGRGQRCLVLAPKHDAVSAFLAELNERINRLNPNIETCLGQIDSAGSVEDVNAFVKAAQRGIRNGRHSVLILDSLNTLATHSVDSLQACERVFRAAEATEEAGTVTIVAVAAEPATAERDEEILRRFRGTGNMELALSLDASQNAVSVDASRSGTKHADRMRSAG